MGDVSPIATPLAEAEVRAQLEEIDVDAPRVGIVMGSKSDMETMEKAARELEERGILHELRVMSAHREPDVVADYAKNARMRGPARDHRRRRHLRGAARRRRRPHRPAGDRRAAVGAPDRRRRTRRDPLDRADAPGRARRLRRPRQRPQRGDPRGADPRR